jgi:uncharacterized protein with FMN-binding domain
MRRALPAIAATFTGLIAVLGYKSGPPPKAVAATKSTSTTADPSASAGSDDGADPAAAPAPSTTTTAPPSSATRSGAFTGPTVDTRFGPVQVKVVVQNGRITDVQALQTPTDRARSAYISSQAAPILREEVLQAQSAQIDIVSGATYTSEGYAESLQAALDGLRK